MNKSDIIAKTLREMRAISPETGLPVNDEQDEEGFIISVLQDVLPHGVDIRLCDDFKYLGVLCCETCHNLYPHYEMTLIDLPNGSKAWVCDTVKWAIHTPRSIENSTVESELFRGRLLRERFSEGVDG
jgi:hypothetical protein